MSYDLVELFAMNCQFQDVHHLISNARFLFLIAGIADVTVKPDTTDGKSVEPTQC